MSYYSPIRLVGFSDKPTLYRMILPRRGDVYVKCGADILLNGLKTDLDAEARCPVCGDLTRFHIIKRRVKDFAPKGPTLHVVEFGMGAGRDMWASSVNQLIFSTRRIASPNGYQPMLASQA